MAYGQFLMKYAEKYARPKKASRFFFAGRVLPPRAGGFAGTGKPGGGAAAGKNSSPPELRSGGLYICLRRSHSSISASASR